MNRREILQLLGLIPTWSFLPIKESFGIPSARCVIFIELKGGNDGLNTLIPYSDDKYFQLRPNISIKKSDAIVLDASFGMHPSLLPLKQLWIDGDLGWVMGLGYPKPNKSHFRSIEIWETGSDSDVYLETGWLARLLSSVSSPLTGISLDQDLGPLADHLGSIVLGLKDEVFQHQVQGKRYVSQNSNPSINHVLDVKLRLTLAARLLEERLSSKKLIKVSMPKTAIGNQLGRVLELQQTRLPISVFKVGLGSFDTHAGQGPKHGRLLKQLADALEAYALYSKSLGLWDSSLLVTYSEFGRRTSENISFGTDHGAAGAHLIAGGSVIGGLHGTYPNLSATNDLEFTVDFRQLYHTVARDWLNIAGSEYKHYEPLQLVGV